MSRTGAGTRSDRRRRAACFALAALGVWTAASSAAPADSDELVDLSLEQLAELEITSLSRRPVNLSSAAASLFVITNDDIRRAGVVTLTEALRLAPNLQVARVNAARYAIGARALNNTLTNKLLVLIDGRQIYTPLFSGVFWDQQDVMLEDIERIEVISGPGATIWGANAVNGVINVITRAASASQGGLVAAGGGSEHGAGALRYGGAFGDEGYYRVYAKALRLEDTEDTLGLAMTDGWRNAQVGFRADWGAPTAQTTLQGDFYQGESDERPAGATEVSGANLLGRWSRQFDGGSELRIRTYVDHVERIDSRNFRDYLDIVDFDFLHYLPRESHRISWGGGYRNVRNRTASSPQLAFLPLEKVLHVENLFVQDEIALRDTLDLTLGLRIERNVYTGTEYLPNVRLAWRPSDSGLLWTSLARAVRTPARIDRELFAPAQPPFVIAGGPDFESEIANVVELGYRGQPSTTTSFSISAFHHDYDELRSLEPSPGGGFVLANGVEGDVQGLEGWVGWQPTDWWRLSAGALWLDKDLRRKPGSLDPNGVRAQGNDPEHQWLLRSAFELGPRQQLDLMLRHVGALPSPAVPSYTAFDLRWGWRPRRELELSVRLQNLFDSSHVEFAASATAPPSEYERALLLKVDWQW